MSRRTVFLSIPKLLRSLCFFFFDNAVRCQCTLSRGDRERSETRVA